MQQLTKWEQDIAKSWSAALDTKAEENVATQLARAIRNLSGMVAAGAECQTVCAAAAECAATMLPGSRSVVFDVSEERQVARIQSKTNAAFLSNRQEISLAICGVLKRALAEPNKVQQEACNSDNPLCASSTEFPCEPDEVLVAKAIPRDDTPSTVLTILCAPETTALAEGILSTFSELLVTLSAGRRVALMHSQSLEEIRCAKYEWERTVDLLPEVVCLIDQNGLILRANRTLERWGLGDVREVRGLHVHDLFHSDCHLTSCAFRDAVCVTLAAQASDGHLQSAITDAVLEKTLIVHTRLMGELPVSIEQDSYPSAVVVVSDVSALLVAQKELAALNQELELRVATRTQELQSSNRELAGEVRRRDAAERELQMSRDELATLNEQLIYAQEEERRRLSRELHDSLGQSLGAIKYSVERVAATYAGSPQGIPPDELAAIVDSLGESIRETRSLAVALRPPMLDELGTVSAIRTLCQNFGETYSKIAFQIEIDVENSDIPSRLSTPIFRITQEALNNAVKHSAASTILVSIRMDGVYLKLEILDDGIGFDSGNADTGEFQQLGKVGRIGMRERATNSIGRLEIESQPGQGTKVSAVWSLDAANKGSEE